MTEPEEAFAILALALIENKKKKKRMNRKMWIHPLISDRVTTGSFAVLYHELRNDSEKFFNYFRTVSYTHLDVYKRQPLGIWVNKKKSA